MGQLNPKRFNLRLLVMFFVEEMEYGQTFRFYSGTSAHDEDYIEYDVYKIFYLEDNMFQIEWFGYPVGKRNIDTMDWEELTDWLKEKWN